MENQEKIDKFWKETERILKNSQSRFSAIYKVVADEVDLTIKGYDIDGKKLKQRLSNQDRQALNNLIEEWKRQGVYNGYFKLYAEYNKKRTYDDLLLLMIMYYYWVKQKSVVELSRKVARATAEDMRKQAQEDSGREFKQEISDKVIDKAMYVNRENTSFADYIAFMMIENANEMMVNLRSWIQAKINITKERLRLLVDKARRKLINFRKDRFSGGLVHVIRSLANRIYLRFFKRDGDKKDILFVAEMDDRTTAMCRSLNGQRFSATGRNVFERYSSETGGMRTYDIVGMVEGINMPPITDHFHWCRSRLMFVKERE